jgi:hypothetical protein
MKPSQMRRLRRAVQKRISRNKPTHAYLRLRRWLGRRGKIYFTPHCPSHLEYSISKVCCILGLEPTTDPAEARIGMVLLDQTEHARVDAPIWLLNQNCTDISKGAVQRAFEQAFGYPLALDPLTHVGLAVCKSANNAAHDGVIIECPIDRRAEGKVYERLVDNTVGDGSTVEDIRVTVVGRQVPATCLKHRAAHRRFDDYNTAVKSVDPDLVFSMEEKRRIARFAAILGMDYGELDVLRDSASGRLYIVDANKTPVSFGPIMRMREKLRALEAIARAFAEEFPLEPGNTVLSLAPAGSDRGRAGETADRVQLSRQVR